MFLTGNQTLTLTSEWQFCVHLCFFAFDILFSILTWSAIRSLSVEISFFLTCFFFFNIVNMLLPFKTMFAYLPPTAFSYFVYYAKFIFWPICVFYFCKWLVKRHWSWINQTSKSALWRRDWSNYGHCRGTTGIGSWNYWKVINIWISYISTAEWRSKCREDPHS